jgi:hypothetical protein
MSKTEYKCNICVKKYSSYKNLWDHNKNFHKEPKNEIVTDYKQYIFACRICNKIFKHKQSIYKHEKMCSYIPPALSEIEVEKYKTNNLDKEREIEKMKQITFDKEKELINLKIKLKNMDKPKFKTFSALNKILINRSINNSNNTNNIINLNFPNIVSLGKENILNILTWAEKKIILNARWMALDKLTEIVHCGKYDRFKNIIVTNLKDKFAQTFDDAKRHFVSKNKSDMFNDLITFRIADLEMIREEFLHTNDIDNKTKERTKLLIDKMSDTEPFTDGDITYPNYKSYKVNDINIMFYNHRDQLTNDLSLSINDDTDEIDEIA